MRIIDRLKSLWTRKTPRVIKDAPGMLTIEARGCRIVINENSLDKRGRELTEVAISVEPPFPPDGQAHGQFQLITNPSGIAKLRSRAAIHVVKLKAPRKPKRAKPPEQEKAIEGPFEEYDAWGTCGPYRGEKWRVISETAGRIYFRGGIDVDRELFARDFTKTPPDIDKGAS